LGLFAFRPDPAQALNYHTWVSNAGADTASCGDLPTPCQTITFAVNRTQAGGKVTCKDGIFSQGASITKTITVVCDVPNTNNTTGSPFIFSIQTGANDIVTLKGLNTDGAGTINGSGIDFSGSGTLVLDNVTATGWINSGVHFAPNGPSRLVVSNSLFSNNGSGTTGGAIHVRPTGSGFAQVAIEHSTISGNVYGIGADATLGTRINITVSDSLISANRQDGINATSGSGGFLAVLVDLARVVNNARTGIIATGGATARVTRSSLTGNNSAVAGQVLSSGSNVVEANGIDGPFSGSFATK
jgi:Right handed beta helix region